jgi:hypothetical protein
VKQVFWCCRCCNSHSSALLVRRNYSWCRARPFFFFCAYLGRCLTVSTKMKGRGTFEVLSAKEGGGGKEGRRLGASNVKLFLLEGLCCCCYRSRAA